MQALLEVHQGWNPVVRKVWDTAVGAEANDRTVQLQETCSDAEGGTAMTSRLSLFSWVPLWFPLRDSPWSHLWGLCWPRGRDFSLLLRSPGLSLSRRPSWVPDSLPAGPLDKPVCMGIMGWKSRVSYLIRLQNGKPLRFTPCGAGLFHVGALLLGGAG